MTSRSWPSAAVTSGCGAGCARLAARSGGRLRVLGFVDNMSDWLRCADVVIAKAGPATIAEAACCGAPLLLTSHLPGQEKGNAHFVAVAGAGLRAPRRWQLLRDLGELRRNPAALTAMRTASAGLGRPGAAAGVATLLAGLTDAGLTDAGLTDASLTDASLTDASLTDVGLTGMRAGQ